MRVLSIILSGFIFVLETMLGELKGYQPKKYPLVSLDEALTMTNNAVREIHGAV